MRQGLKWQITWARMPRLSKQYLPSLCDMCINEQGKTFISVWDEGPVPSPQKKRKKKKDQPLHELSQTRTSWPRSQIVCSAVFLHKGFHGHVEFLMQKKVGETETLFPTEWVIGKKKKWEGRRKRKHFLHVPSPHPNLSNPKSNMVAQWMVLSSLVKCLCWKKVFGVFVKCPSPPLKRTTVMWQS